jgi:hypothetical protein
MALLTSYTGLWLPEHPDRAAALGFGVLIPFGVPMLIALVLGPGLSIFLLREWLLPTFGALTAIPLTLALTDRWDFAGGFLRWYMLIYPVPLVAFSLRWFFQRRPHYIAA